LAYDNRLEAWTNDVAPPGEEDDGPLRNFADDDVPEVFIRLRQHFSEAEIVELTWRIALCGAFNRFNDVLQLDLEQGAMARDAAE